MVKIERVRTSRSRTTACSTRCVLCWASGEHQPQENTKEHKPQKNTEEHSHRELRATEDTEKFRPQKTQKNTGGHEPAPGNARASRLTRRLTPVPAKNLRS